ncbi:MAG: hypothetical protein CMO01_09820 [Thalassobius sp.]|nr:hypothetical protein [Thalassovita sp.]
MKNVSSRVQELIDYKLLDTPTEKELDDIVEIASAICDTPISLITILDNKRQWFKANKGLEVMETPIDQAFCRFVLDKPDEVLVIEDATKDERVKDNPLVLKGPQIRFYAGAPLVSPNGNVLGSLCIIDRVPKKITESQIRALQILAKKTMDYLNLRKLLFEKNAELKLFQNNFNKLTCNSPNILYQFELTIDGKMSFPFISKGIEKMHPSLDAEKLKVNGEDAFKVIHPDDLEMVEQRIHESYLNMTPWDVEYRVIQPDGSYSWHKGFAQPEKREDGTVIWFGTITDVTIQKDYEQALEQISFDISHILRKPVSSILGLLSLIECENKTIDAFSLKKYTGYMSKVSKELDAIVRSLNDNYAEKWDKLKQQRDAEEFNFLN